MHHLTLRVAWHDTGWNGCVCKDPVGNSYCVALDRIRLEKDDRIERGLHEQHFGSLSQSQLPPCKAESGAFMNDREWVRTFKHPYAENEKAKATHGHLSPTKVTIPEYATFAVPFAWMLKRNQKDLDKSLPNPLPPDEKAPFPTKWVFGRARQEAIAELVFGRLTDGQSLVFFYTDRKSVV